MCIYKKEPRFLRPGFFTKLLQIRYGDGGIVKSTIFYQLLTIPRHDALARRIGVWIQYGRGREEGDVRSIEVSSIQDRIALITQEDLAVGEQRVLEELEFAMDGAGVHDADIHAFVDHGVGATEVVELLELGADVRGGDHPVGGATEGGPVDDVGNFEDFVEQSDVAVGEVDGGSGGGGEVVGGPNCRTDNQVVDDFTVDFGDHFISHQIGEGGFGVDVVYGLEVLGGFQRPGGLELAGNGGDGVAVDAQGEFGLEGVGFEVVFVVDAGECADWEGSSIEFDFEFAGGVAEAGVGGINGDTGGDIAAFAEDYDIDCAVGVEGDLDAGDHVFAGGALLGEVVDVEDYGAGEYWAVLEDVIDFVGGEGGDVFVTDLLRGVVGVECPAVLLGEGLAGVLTHDLGSGDRLALGEGVAVADVEDQAGGLAHWLDADEVVGDQASVALADEGEGEPGEVGDVAGGGDVFEQHGAVFGVPGLVLVFKQGGHEAEFALLDFAALLEDWAPAGDVLVFLGFGQDCGFVGVAGFSDCGFDVFCHGYFSLSWQIPFLNYRFAWKLSFFSYSSSDAAMASGLKLSAMTGASFLGSTLVATWEWSLSLVVAGSADGLRPSVRDLAGSSFLASGLPSVFPSATGLAGSTLVSLMGLPALTRASWSSLARTLFRSRVFPAMLWARMAFSASILEFSCSAWSCSVSCCTCPWAALTSAVSPLPFTSTPSSRAAMDWSLASAAASFMATCLAICCSIFSERVSKKICTLRARSRL